MTLFLGSTSMIFVVAFRVQLFLEPETFGISQVELDCESGKVVEKAEGLILTTSREGSGSVDRTSGEVEFDGKVATSIGVRHAENMATTPSCFITAGLLRALDRKVVTMLSCFIGEPVEAEDKR